MKAESKFCVRNIEYAYVLITIYWSNDTYIRFYIKCLCYILSNNYMQYSLYLLATQNSKHKLQQISELGTYIFHDLIIVVFIQIIKILLLLKSTNIYLLTNVKQAQGKDKMGAYCSCYMVRGGKTIYAEGCSSSSYYIMQFNYCSICIK